MGYTQGYSPYTDAQLLGDNVIVAVADTGVDDLSCYFISSTTRVKKSLVGAPVLDITQRKIVQYTYLSSTDTVDTVGGHGTHVCGIVAGNNYAVDSSISIYNGECPVIMTM